MHPPSTFLRIVADWLQTHDVRLLSVSLIDQHVLISGGVFPSGTTNIVHPAWVATVHAGAEAQARVSRGLLDGVSVEIVEYRPMPAAEAVPAC